MKITVCSALLFDTCISGLILENSVKTGAAANETQCSSMFFLV